MTRKLLLLTCLVIALLTSCKEEGLVLSNSDYIIFGHFYGECVGEECVEIFRLEKEKIFEDTKDEYPNANEFYVAKYVQLSEQKYLDTKDLINDFPMDLLKEKHIVIGQPDAGDWGGIYLEYNFNGVRSFWLLDQMKSNVPSKYHSYIDQINDKIRQLQ